MNQQFLAPLILAFATLISAPDCHAIRYLQDNSTGGDCTLVGAWDDAGKTCTLNQDIADTIQINSSNTVLDCNGHQITHGPTSSYAGVNLAWVAGLTDIAVKNCDISGFIIGIDIWPAGGISGFKAISNNVHDNEYGIYVGNSSTALISDNTINDSEFGLYIRNSSTGLISDNTINGIRGIYLFASLEMEVSGNSIDGDGTALGFPWGVGIRISHGSNNNVIINNYVFDLAGPIENNGDNNFVSGNTVDTGGWGIGSQGNFNQIVNNDITGQHWASVMVVGSDNLVASNYVHESSRVQVFTYPVSVALAHRNIVENNIIENGLACKAPCGGTFGYETEAGIVLSSASSQRNFGNNVYGKGKTNDNIIRGNIVRNMVGEGILFDNAGDNNTVANNIITRNARGGITIARPCPDCNYNFMRNDVYHNGGLPLKSIDTDISGPNPWTRIELGPVAIDVAGQDDLGYTIGNWWGGNCGKGLWQASFSNDPSVYDSNPYNHAVANIPVNIARMPKVCPN